MAVSADAFRHRAHAQTQAKADACLQRSLGVPLLPSPKTAQHDAAFTAQHSAAQHSAALLSRAGAAPVRATRARAPGGSFIWPYTNAHLLSLILSPSLFTPYRPHFRSQADMKMTQHVHTSWDVVWWVSCDQISGHKSPDG